MRNILVALLLAVTTPALSMDTFDIRVVNKHPVRIIGVHSRNLETCELSRDIHTGVIQPGDRQTITIGDGIGCNYRIQVDFEDGTEDRRSVNLCRSTQWVPERRINLPSASCSRYR